MHIDMAGIRINSNNFNGESVEITFNPFSGGSIDLGTQTIPYDYLSSNYEGNYSIYIPTANKTCPLQVGTPPTPTPSPTSSVTPSVTPSITPTITPTASVTVTPTPSVTITPTPSASVPSGDPDASAYLADVVASGGTTNPTIEAAVNTLFTDLKSNGLYSKMIAMYPFVGATASSHAINATLDKTYDITWNGGLTHDVSGTTGNGSNGYGEPNFASTNYSSVLQSSWGFYVVNPPTNGVHGYYSGGATRIQFGSNYLGNRTGYGHGSNFSNSNNGGLIDGNFISVRTGNTESKLFHNTTTIRTQAATAGTANSNPIALFNFYNGTNLSNTWCDDTLGFTFFADNITYAEVSTLDGIINDFQTALGRNTYT